MPNTITAGATVATQCAVFKIDLRNRFVYIDDITEDLLGLEREELFGKSIFEFISDASRETLDKITCRHNRYESFYEALTLSMRMHDGVFYSFDAVITLNFIGGNPVNYQLVLLPAQMADVGEEVNHDRLFLQLLATSPDEIAIDDVAEAFCRAGGYVECECYLPDKRGALITTAAYPARETGFSAPACLELFAIDQQNRFSFNGEDRALHEGFGHSRAEAVLFLYYRGEKKLVLRLQGAADYQPTETRLDDLNRYCELWNRRFGPEESHTGGSEQFALLGQAADALETGIAIIDDEYTIVFANESFGLLTGAEIGADATDFKTIYAGLGITDAAGQKLPFEQSPFARAVNRQQLSTVCGKLPEHEMGLVMGAVPLPESRPRLYLLSLMEPPEGVVARQAGREFLLTVTHDLKAPLITLDAFTRRLLSHHCDELNDDGQFAVNCMKENIQILFNMIGSLEELSQSWMIDEAPTDVALSGLLGTVVEELKATYPSADYLVTIPGVLPTVHLPEHKLRHLFRILLDNAYKYSAAADVPSIQIDYRAEGDWHRFTVSDNGRGIDEAYRAKVFEPFFREPDVAELPGTGMGLAIAHDIAASLGGLIELEPKDGPGSAMTVSLPLATGG